MSESETNEIEFPQKFENEAGASIVANDAVQAAAFEKQGFKPVGKYTPPKK